MMKQLSTTCITSTPASTPPQATWHLHSDAMEQEHQEPTVQQVTETFSVVVCDVALGNAQEGKQLAHQRLLPPQLQQVGT
jgi:hypothetical protein